MIKLALVGAGKMGLSHLAVARMHPDVKVVAVCDTSKFVLGVLRRYSDVDTFRDVEQMLDEVAPDALIIATPSATHRSQIEQAIDRGTHIFCEKPLTLRADESLRLAALAQESDVVSQVGYHHRFIGAFREVHRLLSREAIGIVVHGLAEAYGPVVLNRGGRTWRSQQSDGGGCLYDYAAHAINLLNWYLGPVAFARGSVLGRVFSEGVEDVVHTTLHFQRGATAQVLANWSDGSQRRMGTRVTIWGTHGRIEADRQECRVHLSQGASIPPGYREGWNVRYTTDLTQPVWFYLRGEEYSAQIAGFVERVGSCEIHGLNSFDEAAETDRAIEMILDDARGCAADAKGLATEAGQPKRERRRPFSMRQRKLWTSS